MTLRPYSLTAILLSLVAFPSMAQDPDNKWNPHVEAEGKWGTDRSLGEVGVFLPIWQDEDSLLFGNIIGRLDDQDSNEGNFGAGFRQQVSPDWAVGGYGFYDRRRTDTGNHFNQITLGIEAFRDNMEFRVNGYIPESDEKIISGTGGAVSTAASATGGNLQLITTTTGARRERALAGIDGEAGYKFKLPDNWEAWAYVGGYHFSEDGYEDVTGPRGRVEVSYNNAPYLGDGSKLTVGIESQKDDVRDDQHFAVARIRIPLNRSSVPKPVLSALDQRMTTRIVRDVDVISGSPTAAPAPLVTTETAQATLGSGATVSTYTVIDANDTIATEVTNAGDNTLIVLDGSAGTINTAAQINVRDGQTIIGAGGTLSVTGVTSGKIATVTLPGTAATVNQTNGGVNSFSINGRQDVRLNNFSITGGNIAVVFSNATDSSATNLTTENVWAGAETRGGSNITLTSVTVDNANRGFNIGGGINGLSFINTNASNINNAAHIFIINETASNIVFTNATANTINQAIIYGSTATWTNISGNITATNILNTACVKGGGATVNNSTLLINGVLCN